MYNYNNILVAVDLAPGCHELLLKAVSLAKCFNSELYVIHVDRNFSDLYTGILDFNIDEIQQKTAYETLGELKKIAKDINYPIKNFFSSSGKLDKILMDKIQNYSIDLLICGHHHDFISKITSSVKHLLNIINIDMLVISVNESCD